MLETQLEMTEISPPISTIRSDEFGQHSVKTLICAPVFYNERNPMSTLGTIISKAIAKKRLRYVKYDFNKIN